MGEYCKRNVNELVQKARATHLMRLAANFIWRRLPNNQLDILSKLILNTINEHAPLMKTKVMRPPAPWMKDFEINKLQRERDHWRHKAHSKQTSQLWEKFRAIRNKIKKVINQKKRSFYKKVFQSKNKNDIWNFIHCVLSPNQKTLKVDPEKLNEFFHKTAERLVGKRKTDNATLRLYISSMKDKSNSFKPRLATPTEVSQLLKHCANTVPQVTLISKCHS